MTMQWLVPGLAAILAGPAFAQTTQKGAVDRGVGVSGPRVSPRATSGQRRGWCRSAATCRRNPLRVW